MRKLIIDCIWIGCAVMPLWYGFTHLRGRITSVQISVGGRIMQSLSCTSGCYTTVTISNGPAIRTLWGVESVKMYPDTLVVKTNTLF